MFSERAKRVIDSKKQRAASAALVIETRDGRALIVKAHYKPYWTFPGGSIDHGETPLEAAIREVAEEVGIRLDRDRTEFLFVADRISEIAQTYQFVFRVVVDEAELATVRLQRSEITESELVTKADIIDGKRYYGKAIRHWAHDERGYIEQLFTGANE